MDVCPLEAIQYDDSLSIFRVDEETCTACGAAARGGLGAVMGSKRVKGIAVRGSGSTVVEDKRALGAEIEEVLRRIQRSNPVSIHEWPRHMHLPWRSIPEARFPQGGQ